MLYCTAFFKAKNFVILFFLSLVWFINGEGISFGVIFSGGRIFIGRNFLGRGQISWYRRNILKRNECVQEDIFKNKIVKEISEVKCRSFRRKFRKEISEVKLYFGPLVLTALKCYCLDNGHRTRQHDGAKNNFDETIITIFFQL